MEKSTYLFLGVLIVVVAGGIVFTVRPGLDHPLPYSGIDQPAASPIDDTIPFPPVPSEPPEPQKIAAIAQAVRVTLKTSLGDIELELDGEAAPFTVGNFVFLAQQDFYDGTSFHRVIPDFMVQGGDPFSKDPALRERHGTGGPGYQFKDEFNSRKLIRGEIAMANSGPNTNGSQFFILTGEAFPHLDGKHTNFGTVTSGMEVLDAISALELDTRDNPITTVTIEDVVVHNAPGAEFDGLEVVE